MPGGKKKEASASSSKKTTPPSTTQPKRSDTDSSSNSLKSFFSNMTITPAMRSTPRRTLNLSEESGKGKVIARTASPENIPRVDIPIDVNSGMKPKNWLMFTVPFDLSCRREMFSWTGSEGYDFKNAQTKETEEKRMMYLDSLRPKDNVKQDVTAFLRFTETMEQEQDEAFADVLNCVPLILMMAQRCDLRVDLLFDTDADPRLKEYEYRSVAANMVQAAIMMVQDGKLGDVERKVNQLYKKRHGMQTPDLMMSGGLPCPHPDDPVIQVRDYERQQSGGHIRRTVFQDSDAEFYEKYEPSQPPAAAPHYVMGDERDDVILPDPKPMAKKR